MSLTREEVCFIDTLILYRADYFYKNHTVEKTFSDDGTMTLRFTCPEIPKEAFNEIYQSCKESAKNE